MFARQLAVDAYEPDKILITAQRIAQFPQPLPDGYKFLIAADFKVMQFLVLEHEPSHQQLTFYGLPFAFSEENSKNLLDRAYDMGINAAYTVAKFHDLKSRGQEKVSGETMNYMLGTFTNPANERDAEGFVGCIGLNKAAKNILIYSYPDADHAYNQQVTMNLLNSLKGF